MRITITKKYDETYDVGDDIFANITIEDILELIRQDKIRPFIVSTGDINETDYARIRETNSKRARYFGYGWDQEQKEYMWYEHFSGPSEKQSDS